MVDITIWSKKRIRQKLRDKAVKIKCKRSKSKCNKGIRILLCVIDILNKYAWVVSFEEKIGVTIFNVFQSIVNKSKRKPNKICVDQGNKFYENSF